MTDRMDMAALHEAAHWCAALRASGPKTLEWDGDPKARKAANTLRPWLVDHNIIPPTGQPTPHDRLVQHGFDLYHKAIDRHDYPMAHALNHALAELTETI